MPDAVADSFVIDGSAAINAAVVEGAFAGWAGIRLLAPTLIWSEVASGLTQLRWRGDISDEELDAAIGRLLAAPLIVVRSQELLAEAVGLARDLGWAKSYDAEYVVLASRRNVPLITVDARLAARARDRIQVLSPAEVSV